MSALPDSDGWIEWAGGECPCRGHVTDLKFRNGEDVSAEFADEYCGDFYNKQPCTPQNDNWMHSGDDWDIVAYRLVQS